MELYAYGRMVRRRWWLPVGLLLLVGLFSALQLRPWQPAPVSYSATMRLLLGVRPLSDAETANYDPRYFAWLTSEYLVDDFTEVVGSELFAQAVSRRLAAEGLQMPAGTIQGSANTGKQHRIITLTLHWHDLGPLQAMAEAATDELTENAHRYFEQLGTEGALVSLLDQPTYAAATPDLRRRLELPLRLALALAVGMGLLLLLDYLDTSVRERRELEELGYVVLGEIPKQR